MREGLTFNDVLLQPRYSDVSTRRQLSTRTRLSRNIWLNIPIISANMDTVTESAMATRLAELGGIGMIHRFLTIERQAIEVKKVKRSHNFVIQHPYAIDHEADLAAARQIMKQHDIHGLLVADKENRLKGIITYRDLLFEDDDQIRVATVMTPLERLVYKEVHDGAEIDFNEARQLMKQHKLEKLPLTDSQGKIRGLITVKDIQKRLEFPHAIKDTKGRLLVGAAIGVKNDYMERAQALAEADVDVLVLDIAHGHSRNLLDTLYRIKEAFPQIDVIAGNVATREGTQDLIAAGADSVKAGIGGGAVCSTRLVTGSGVPQLTAVMDCYEIAREADIPLISDGGIRYSGDIVKALAAGASSVMLGSLFAGCEESPGITRIKDGQKYKVYRGMASFDAALNRASKEQGYEVDLNDYVPEGIETTLPYKGKVEEVVAHLIGGVRSGMSYLGVHDIAGMVEKAEFIKMSGAGWYESTPHAQK